MGVWPVPVGYQVSNAVDGFGLSQMLVFGVGLVCCMKVAVFS